MTPRGRAEINIWDEDGIFAGTYLVEDFERMHYEVNREGMRCSDGFTSVPSPAIESIVFKFELPLRVTTYLYPKETP